MKRSVSLILALVLAVSCLPLFTASADLFPLTMWVKTPNGKTVNVRNDQDGDIIGRLPYGTKITAIDEEDIWIIINYNGQRGYIKEAFLVESNPGKYQGGSEKEDEKGNVLTDSALGSQTVNGLNAQYKTLTYVQVPYTVKVVPDTRTSTARLRWAPSKFSTLITHLPLNYELTVLAANKNWLMVRDETSGKVGYIAVKYTTPVK